MELDIGEVLGRKVLVLGEVGRGKTRLTSSLLERVVAALGANEVTAIDMAPTTARGIGARLSAYTDLTAAVRYLAPPAVRAPRLEGRNAEEVSRLARYNAGAIEPLISSYLNRKTKALIVNDLSIYLHAGDISVVLECMKAASTFIANAYYGDALSDDKGSGITQREKETVDELVKSADIVLRL